MQADRREWRSCSTVSAGLVKVTATQSNRKRIVCIDPAIFNAEAITSFLQPVKDALINRLPPSFAIKISGDFKIDEWLSLPVSAHVVDSSELISAEVTKG